MLGPLFPGGKVEQRVERAEAGWTSEKGDSAQDVKDDAERHAAMREWAQCEENHTHDSPDYSIGIAFILLYRTPFV